MKHSISKSGNVMIVFGYVCDYGFDRDVHMNMDLDVVDTTARVYVYKRACSWLS